MRFQSIATKFAIPHLYIARMKQMSMGLTENVVAGFIPISAKLFFLTFY
ncbi:hypothetical protein D1AOALGA4SA_11976 [Olavius algarvensis Delta 1 endosymbiont]|nr:hypothetical protein D1AOALGA4SA_11976 [Olavius algarvensis Delta 1 endosymbiont]